MDATIDDLCHHLLDAQDRMEHFARADDLESWARNYGQAIALKRQLLSLLAGEPSLASTNKHVRKVLKRLRHEASDASEWIKQIQKDGLADGSEMQVESEEDLRRLEEELLYSWFAPSDFVRRLLETTTAVTAEPLPLEVARLVVEARRCYAFGQRVAASCVCRAALEEVVNLLVIRKGHMPDVRRDKSFHEQYPFNSFRLSRLCSDRKEDQDRIYALYCDLSSVAHAGNTELPSAWELLKETVAMLEILFTRYR